VLGINVVETLRQEKDDTLGERSGGVRDIVPILSHLVRARAMVSENLYLSLTFGRLQLEMVLVEDGRGARTLLARDLCLFVISI
jgi:hypothetical protein